MGPMGSSGSGGGSTANVFIPPAQGAAAGAYGDILGPLAGMSMGGGAGTPGAWAYPQAQNFVSQSYNPTQQFLTGSPTGAPTLYDQNVGMGYGSAVNAANLYSSGFGNTYGQIPALTGAAGSMLGYAPQVGASAFSPDYSSVVSGFENNPFFPGAMAGAQQGAALGGAGANSLYGAGMGLLQQGFDPQGALFGRTQQQLADQLGAVNAMSGVGSSPYGAGVMGKGLSDFDINWQNNQLQRMNSAAGAASPLLQAAPGLAYQSGQLPNQAYGNNLSQIIAALDARNKAGGLGAASLSSLLGGAGQGLTSAQNILGSSTGGLASSGMLPYQSGATIANNALTGLNNQQSLLSGATNIGNNQYLLPQQILGDLMQYMGMGQTASQISGNLGQMGFNQTANGIGGALSGANTMFGNNGMFGNSGLFGSNGGLFGAGGLFGPAEFAGNFMGEADIAELLPLLAL